MSYSFKGRVRYSEIGENGCLTLPGIQDYYQDSSHSSLKALDREWRFLRIAREPGYFLPGRL